MYQIKILILHSTSSWSAVKKAKHTNTSHNITSTKPINILQLCNITNKI